MGNSVDTVEATSNETVRKLNAKRKKIAKCLLKKIRANSKKTASLKRPQGLVSVPSTSEKRTHIVDTCQKKQSAVPLVDVTLPEVPQIAAPENIKDEPTPVMQFVDPIDRLYPHDWGGAFVPLSCDYEFDVPSSISSVSLASSVDSDPSKD